MKNKKISHIRISISLIYGQRLQKAHYYDKTHIQILEKKTEKKKIMHHCFLIRVSSKIM